VDLDLSSSLPFVDFFVFCTTALTSESDSEDDPELELELESESESLDDPSDVVSRPDPPELSSEQVSDSTFE